MSSGVFLKEMQTIGEKLLLKLQKLPKADPVEIVSFCVVLLFIGKFSGRGGGGQSASSTGTARSVVFVDGSELLAVVFQAVF
uniref:Small integral membrane protein 5 n=1 Tax=Pavo cristatus TaxID=9049 RepID=A0A8C9FMS9_PAVCR